MKIVVCIKQVPQTTDVKFDPTTNTLIREGVESQINPFDLYALEEAVRVRERLAEAGEESTVTAISMGIPQVEASLREAITLGADDAILLSDRGFAGSDTWATSFALASAVTRVGADLVLCGMQAIDGDTAQVGPEMAQLLGIPQITYVDKVEIDGKKVLARKQVEDGYEMLEAKMPVLLTFMTPSDFVPTNPPFSKISKAQKKPLETWGVKEVDGDPEKLGLKGSFTTVTKVYSPPRREKAVMIEGSPEQIATTLADILGKEGFY